MNDRSSAHLVQMACRLALVCTVVWLVRKWHVIRWSRSCRPRMISVVRARDSGCERQVIRLSEVDFFGSKTTCHLWGFLNPVALFLFFPFFLVSFLLNIEHILSLSRFSLSLQPFSPITLSSSSVDLPLEGNLSLPLSPIFFSYFSLHCEKFDRM